jgi:hypothetical protein
MKPVSKIAVWQRSVLFLARLYLLAAHPALISQFYRKLGYWPNPAFPQRYHEKLLWRKILDRDVRFVHLSDKLAAKKIAQARCPEVAVAKVLWAGSEPRLLPASLVAKGVVVKTNHGSGFNIFVAEDRPDYRTIVRKLERWMEISHDRKFGEWGYRDVPRRIFVEEKLVSGGGELPTDIKVHTFGSKIGHVWVADKLARRSRTYSADGTPLEVRDNKYRAVEQALPDTPLTRALVRQAIELAPRLLGGHDYARVDFIVAGTCLYFGEFTLYPDAGYDRWLDSGLTSRAEALWDLRRSDFFRKPHRGLARLYADALRARIESGTNPLTRSIASATSPAPATEPDVL